MSSKQHVIEHDFRFYGTETPSVSADNGFWRKTVTAAAGSPTLVGAGGHMVATLGATNEVENLALSFGDVLPFAIDKLLTVDIWGKCSASFGASDALAFGMAATRNDAIDSIAAQALFRLVGNNNVLLETYDGVHNLDDQSAGQTLEATLKHFQIDFASGLQWTPPPAVARGGKGSVRFLMDDVRGNLMRLCPNVDFNMSNYSGSFQFLAQLQKTAATTTPSFSLRRVLVREAFP